MKGPQIMHIIVTLSDEAFAAFGLHQLDESRWMPSEHSGYSYRIDPARPEMRQQRHVHIARDKHVSAKNKQVAWNDDRTRHDKKTFNTAFKSMPTAKDIARKALGLPSNVVFESIAVGDRLPLLIKAVLDESLAPAATIADTVCLILRGEL
jgi:hypothetical protein